MASLASLNPFADLADGTKKNKGKKQQSMHEMNNNKNNINNNYNNINNINNNPFGLGLGIDDTFGNVTTNNANKKMHIDHLADFDPLASPPKKAENNNNNNFNNKNTTTTTTVSSTNTTTNDNNNYELEKTYSCEDDLQKLSMLVHRGTLNEAEKMVAREMVMDRTPGISFAISSAICKNKQELLKLIAMHQGGHFHGNDDPNTSNKWNSNSDDGALNIFEENNFDSGFFETSDKDSSKKKGTNDFNNTTSSFDHAKWENENQGVDQDNWFKTTTSGDDRNTTTSNKTDRSSSSHANYIQSPTHNIKRVDPQSLSQRHIDYDKFKTTSQGALVGMCMQRVTSKKILRKWSPRYFVLTKNALCLYKEVWEYTKGKPPKLQVPLHRLMLISDVYVFTKEDALQGPRRAYQFKILENKLSEHFSTMHYQQFSRTLPSVEVCKLGHVDQKAATLLRTELVKAVLEKQNNAGASVGKQVVSGRYE